MLVLVLVRSFSPRLKFNLGSGTSSEIGGPWERGIVSRGAGDVKRNETRRDERAPGSSLGGGGGGGSCFSGISEGGECAGRFMGVMYRSRVR